MDIHFLETIVSAFSEYLNNEIDTTGMGINDDWSCLKLNDYIILTGGFLISIVLYIFMNYDIVCYFYLYLPSPIPKILEYTSVTNKQN